MAITTVYYRHKTDRGWRYSALGIGRRPESAKMGPFFIRVRDGANKYKWQKHDSEAAAKKAAELAPVTHKAQELGLLPDDLTEETNKNRVPIKTAIENYLNERRFGRPRSIKAYQHVFEQLLGNLPGGTKFIDRGHPRTTARREGLARKKTTGCSRLHLSRFRYQLGSAAGRNLVRLQPPGGHGKSTRRTETRSGGR